MPLEVTTVSSARSGLRHFLFFHFLALPVNPSQGERIEAEIVVRKRGNNDIQNAACPLFKWV
jgi:hypothetical protein